ncbi:MAG: glycosyl hydrolase 53 family protein [Bacteroidetes bacterium]|nr:glycosyl hydrolase 53 family protein [Bacteroidota bacterium]MBS1650190.1 glycosyl hydrolase 53 family protein [Bacteroidota bacterium]
MKFIINGLFFLLFTQLSACSKSNDNNSSIITPIPPSTSSFTLIKGADISWLTQMEAAGNKFYNSTGVQQDCIQILKDAGINAMRLRVWVNPSDGWCNTADVIAKASRIKALGLKLMIDFHYSDSWADPGKQNKPAAWVGQNITQLQTSVYNHTYAVLNSLRINSIKPDWVQVGNETNDGMLWPEGKASTNMSNFAYLINSGYNAVKAIDSSIKVIVHLSNGYDNALYRWMFDGLKTNSAKWDVIGMSLYPSTTNYTDLNNQCLANMNDMASRYGKEIMICEVGMSWDQPSACKSFISDLITKVNAVPNNKGLGIFYWEPECYNNWQGYTLGAFDNSGKPTIALDAFK